MTTRLEYRTNNAYDSIVLVDEASGLVRSDWTVDPQALRDFCDCSQDAGDWDDRFGGEHTGDEYGTLVAIRRGYTLEAVDVEAWERRLQVVAH